MPQFSKKTLCLSVVSHEQDELVDAFLESMSLWCQSDRLVVIVVRNTMKPSSYTFTRFPFPVTILQNSRPKGFGANHNQAFARCNEDYFCVVNPDIILTSDPFDQLISLLSVGKVGVAAPVLVDSSGKLQDSARLFPTPRRIVSRVLGLREDEYDNYSLSEDCISPDWVAGMFMIFPSPIYEKIGGFDEHYFMYCEDADICMRLKNSGYSVLLNSHVSAVHNPRRNSHRSPMHLWWHLTSLLRFFLRYPFYTL